MRFLAKAKLSANRYKTAEGYLVCLNCILSRTGTQQYRRGEFDKAAENPYDMCDVIRTAENVFEPEAMASFENKPLTLQHPSGMVTLDNFKELSKGFVRDIKRGKDGDTDVMIGDIVVTDKETIEAIESGRMKDLSCGYDAEVEIIDGKFIQTKIRGNHVALVDEGRAGNTRIVDSAPEKDAKAVLTVQCYIFDKDSIVVQHRVGPVWKGIAVPGGHVNVGETPEQACIREVKEETGLDVSNLELVGTHQYHCEKDGDCIAMLYKTSTFSGELTDSDEGKVEWMDLDAVSASDECAEGFKDLLKIVCRTKVETIDLESNATHDDKMLKRGELYEVGGQRVSAGTLKEAQEKVGHQKQSSSKNEGSKASFNKESIASIMTDLTNYEKYKTNVDNNIGTAEYEAELTKLGSKVNKAMSDIIKSKYGIEFEGSKTHGLVVDISDEDYDKLKKALREDFNIDLEPVSYKSASGKRHIQLNNLANSLSNSMKDSAIHDISPKEGETRVDFIGRAMSELKEEYPDEQQRLAVAYGYWKKAHHKDAAEADYRIKFKPGLGGHYEVYCGTRFVGSADDKTEAMELIKEDRHSVKDAVQLRKGDWFIDRATNLIAYNDIDLYKVIDDKYQERNGFSESILVEHYNVRLSDLKHDRRGLTKRGTQTMSKRDVRDVTVFSSVDEAFKWLKHRMAVSSSLMKHDSVGPMDAQFLLVDLKNKLYFAEPNKWVGDKAKATRFTEASARRKRHELGNNVALYNEATNKFYDSVKLAKYAKYASLVAKLPK